MLPNQELFHMARLSPGTARLARCQGPACQWDWKFLKSCHQPEAGRAPQTKASHRVQQLACEGPICSAILSCGPAPALPCAAQLSAQELFYHYFHRFITFLGIQISVTVLDAPGEEWCLPPSPPPT